MDYADDIADKLIPETGFDGLTPAQIRAMIALAARQGYRLAYGMNAHPSVRSGW